MRGYRIRQRREDLGMTQQELADKLLVTVQAVSQWENGKTQPDSDRIPQLAKLLRTTADDLLDDAAPIAVSWQLSDRMFSEERMYSKLKAFAQAEGLDETYRALPTCARATRGRPASRPGGRAGASPTWSIPLPWPATPTP